MRELPSLCFALRREKDVNDAQKLYQNMTKEKQALLKALQRMHASSELDRERAAAAMEDQLSGFNNVITRLQETADSARQASDLVSARYGDSVSSLVADVQSGAQEATRAVMNLLSQQLPGWLTSTMANELSRVADSHSQELGALAQSKLDALLHQLQQGVEQQLRRHDDHMKELSASLHASQGLVNEVVVGLNAVHAATVASVRELDAHRKTLSGVSAFNVDRLNHLDSLLSRVEGVAQQELERWDRQEQRRQQREQQGLWTRIITSAFGHDDEEAPQVFSLTNAMVKAMPFAKVLLYSGVPAPVHVLLATTFALIKLGWSVISLLFTVWLLLFALSTRMLRPLTSRLAQWLERSVRGPLLRERRPRNIEEASGCYDSEDEDEVEAMLEVELLRLKTSRSPTPACLHHAAPVTTTFPPPSSLHNMTALSGDRTRRSMSAF